MTTKGVGLAPRVHRPAWVIVGLATFALLAAGAQAATYTNAANHYHFTAPDGWVQANGSSGNDVTYTGPMTNYITAQISVATDVNNSSAANDQATLLAALRPSCDTVKAMFNGTYATAPRSFATTSGRAAAECKIDYSFFGLNFTQRVVAFGSGFYHNFYIMTVVDELGAYSTHQSIFDTAVNSFAVDNEQATGGGGGGGSGGSGAGLLSGTTLYILIIVVVAAVAAAVVMMRGKKKKAAAQPPAAAPPAAPPPPQR